MIANRLIAMAGLPYPRLLRDIIAIGNGEPALQQLVQVQLRELLEHFPAF